jgi:hypothetical protein
MMATATVRSSFLRRLMGAAALDTGTFEEIESDPRATAQALLVVVISSAAAGIGAVGFGAQPIPSVVLGVLIALLVWGAWALITFEIGARILPGRQTRSSVDELLRTIGYATAPGVFRVFGAVPGAATPVFAVTAVWMLASMVVAVRQALDYETTMRAIAVCLLGWALTTACAVAIGLAFSPVVS